MKRDLSESRSLRGQPKTRLEYYWTDSNSSMVVSLEPVRNYSILLALRVSLLILRLFMERVSRSNTLTTRISPRWKGGIYPGRDRLKLRNVRMYGTARNSGMKFRT